MKNPEESSSLDLVGRGDEMANIPSKEMLDHNKWMLCKYQNITYPNLHTSHTYDMVVGNFRDHMVNLFKRLFKLEFRAVEMPRADADAQRKHITPAQMLDSSFLPRAIVNFNQDINAEMLVDIHTQQQAFYARSNGTFCVSNIKQKRLGRGISDVYSYMRDIDFSIVASPKLSSSYLFFTVLVNEQPRAYEIAKHLKYHFPLNVTNEWYYSADYHNDPYKTPSYSPYRLEALIPDEITNHMLEMFQLSNDYAGKEELIQILKRHSNNTMEWKVNAATGIDAMACTYASPMWMTCTNIDVSEIPIESTFSYMIRIEFRCDYYDLMLFKLSASLIRINKDCIELQIENKTYPDNSVTARLPVHIAYFKEDIDGTTIWDTYKLQYIKDDMVSETMLVNGKMKSTSYAEFKMSEVSMQPVINEYIKFILEDNKCKLNHSLYFNIAVKRQKILKGEEKVYGTDKYIDLDYVNDRVKDYKAEIGDTIWVAIYINKDFFHKWAASRGYEPNPNLSSYGS